MSSGISPYRGDSAWGSLLVSKGADWIPGCTGMTKWNGGMTARLLRFARNDIFTVTLSGSEGSLEILQSSCPRRSSLRMTGEFGGV